MDEGRQAVVSRGTVRTVFVNLSAVFSAAVDDGLIVRNPCSVKSVKPPPPARGKVRPWTGERVMSMRTGLPARYRATVDVGAGAGLRQGEVFGLAVDDVDFLRHNIHVHRQVEQIHGRLVFAPPKGGKDRDVPLPDLLAMRLAAHLQEWPAVTVTLPWLVPDGRPVSARLFFSSRERKSVNRNYYNSNLWKPALVAAGVIPAPKPGARYDPSRDQGFHQLRHYYASAMLAGGVDVRALAEFLGHEDPGFTLRVYAHLMPQSKDRARQAADAALGAGTPDVPPVYRASS
jgi:integrase